MVIQIPNPLLLPQSYGMGEVAGMSFGSNYVIMMQIGYRYYAPRIIEEMEKDNLDHPMGTVWWNKWQKFMLTYSDQSIKNTMDRTLQMPEQALKAIWDKIFNILPSNQDIDDGTTTLTSASQLGEIHNVRLGGGSRDVDIVNQQVQDTLNDIIKARDELTEQLNKFALDRQEEARITNLQKDVTVKTGISGAKQFTITKPSRATGTATGIFRTSTEVRKPQESRMKAPRSIETQWKKLKEQRRIYDMLASKEAGKRGQVNKRNLQSYIAQRNIAMNAQAKLQKKYFSPAKLWP